MLPVLPERAPLRRGRDGLPERRVLGLPPDLRGALRPGRGRVAGGGAAHGRQVRVSGGGAQGKDVSGKAQKKMWCRNG